MKRKASIGLELILVIVLVFGLGLVVFIGKTVIDDLNTDIQADSDLSAEAKTVSANLHTRYTPIFDGAIMLLYVLLWVAILVSAFVIDTHPAFFIVSVIVIVIVLVFAIGISQGYAELITDAEFSSMDTEFPMTNFILSNLLALTIIQAFSIVVVLYGKLRS